MKKSKQIEQARNFAQELINAGLKVYSIEENFTWGYFTDGAGIGYFQAGSLVDGVGMSTCHIPNHSIGTGFRMYDFLDVKFAQDIVDGGLPYWVSNSDRENSKPWGSWENFARKSSWNFIEFSPKCVDTP